MNTATGQPAAAGQPMIPVPLVPVPPLVPQPGQPPVLQPAPAINKVQLRAEIQNLQAENKRLSQVEVDLKAKIDLKDREIKSEVEKNQQLGEDINYWMLINKKYVAFTKKELNKTENDHNQKLKSKDREIESTKKARDLYMIRSQNHKNAYCAAKAENYPAFVRTVTATVSFGGGLAAAYMAYNNPTMLVDFLQALDYEFVKSVVLPYAQQIGGVGAGILGYAISSYLGAPILFSGMKLVQGFDYILKYLLLTLPLEIIKGCFETIVDILKLIYEYRGTVGLLLIAGIAAYYNPEIATDLLSKACSCAIPLIKGGVHYTGMALNGLYYGATEYGLPALSTIMNGVVYGTTEYGLPALSTIMNGVVYGATEYGIPMLSSVKDGVVYCGSAAYNMTGL